MRIVSISLVVCALAGCATSRAPEDENAPRASSARANAINHYLVGVVHQRNGRFEEAIAEFRKASDFSPADVRLLKKLIRSYTLIHDFENAWLMCKRAVQIEPGDPVLWFALGQVNRNLERYDEATAAFQKAISLNPGSALGYEELIRAEEESNDLVASIDIYEKLLELHPEAAPLRVRLAINLARINETDAAIAHLEKALELKPELARPNYILGILYLDKKRNEEAIACFERCLATDSADAGARGNLAAALVRTGRLEEALPHLEKLCSSAEGEPKHPLQYAYVLMLAERYADAAEVVPPDEAPIFGTLLRALARRGQGEPYLPLLRTLDAVQGDCDLECSAFLSDLLFISDGSAHEDFFTRTMEAVRGEEVRSKRLDAIHARALMLQERDPEAEAILLKALDEFGADKWLHYYLAGIYEEAGDLVRTEQHLKACLDLDPDDPEVMNFLGYFYADHGMKLDEAEKLLLRALEADPESGFYLDSLGWVYYRQGKAGLAVEYIRRAILRMENDDAILRDHLGDAYLLNGEREKALGEWQRALRLDPELEGVQEKIQAHSTPPEPKE